MVDTIEEVDISIEEIVAPEKGGYDPNVRVHIVNPPKNVHIWKPGMCAQDVVDIARATEQKVTALCGYTWVPRHKTDKYDVCEPCLLEAHKLLNTWGEGD